MFDRWTKHWKKHCVTTTLPFICYHFQKLMHQRALQKGRALSHTQLSLRSKERGRAKARARGSDPMQPHVVIQVVLVEMAKIDQYALITIEFLQ